MGTGSFSCDANLQYGVLEIWSNGVMEFSVSAYPILMPTAPVRTGPIANFPKWAFLLP
jgi:hypothetical protein